MFQCSPDESSGFLPGLTRAFTSLDPTTPLSTAAFADACEKVMPIFDHIGAVFVIAKHEFAGKRETVSSVAHVHLTLDEIVAAGKQDKSITVKNSPSRNLHRLLNTLAFISAIFKNLQQGKQLKEAVSDAYDATLGLIHTWVVRAGIKTGMLGLPTREQFFKSIGETEETARGHGEGFTAAADSIVSAVERLYVGVEMPRSDFSVSALWS